jgi:hypothetical protein
MSPEYFTDMLKNWGPMSDAAMSSWRTMMDQIAVGRK